MSTQTHYFLKERTKEKRWWHKYIIQRQKIKYEVETELNTLNIQQYLLYIRNLWTKNKSLFVDRY